MIILLRTFLAVIVLGVFFSGGVSSQTVIYHGPESCADWIEGNYIDRATGGDHILPLDSNAVAAMRRGETVIVTNFVYQMVAPGVPHRNSSCNPKRYLFSLARLSQGAGGQTVPEAVNYNVDWQRMDASGPCRRGETIGANGVGAGSYVRVENPSDISFYLYIWVRNNWRTPLQVDTSCQIYLRKIQ